MNRLRSGAGLRPLQRDPRLDELAGQIAAAPLTAEDYDTRGGAVVRGAASSRRTVRATAPGHDRRACGNRLCRRALFMEPALSHVGIAVRPFPTLLVEGTGAEVFTARLGHPGARRTDRKAVARTRRFARKSPWGG